MTTNEPGWHSDWAIRFGRYYTFRPTENKIYAYTYSPSLEQYETDPNSQFALDYEMSASAVVVPGRTGRDARHPNLFLNANPLFVSD